MIEVTFFRLFLITFYVVYIYMISLEVKYSFIGFFRSINKVKSDSRFLY